MQVKDCHARLSYIAPMRKVKLHKLVIGRRGLAYSLGLCVLILGIGGLGFWGLEPRAETYSDGLWLAFTTAATVGYGDIVPSTHASRFFAVVVVLMGLEVRHLRDAVHAPTTGSAQEKAGKPFGTPAVANGADTPERSAREQV